MDYQFLMPRTFGSSVEFLNLTAELCKAAIALDIKGSFGEVGVAYGSHGIVMMDISKGERDVWMFDSYMGINLHGPEDKEWTEAHGIREESDPRNSGGITACSLSQVMDTIRMAGQDPADPHFIFVQGWVADTLPQISAHKNLKFSVLRLDVDLYSPYMDSFKWLLPMLSENAFLIVDDWCLSGMQQALTDSGLDKEWFTVVEYNGYQNAYLNWTWEIKQIWEARKRFKNAIWDTPEQK